MRTSFWDSVKGYFRSSNRWFLRTPERALNEAYDAALMLKNLEDTHFGGNRISTEYSTYSRSAQNYFQAELKKYLDIIKLRLAEFKTSSSIIRVSGSSVGSSMGSSMSDRTFQETNLQRLDNGANDILRKLRFIDEVLGRYNHFPEPSSVIVVADGSQAKALNSQKEVEQGIREKFMGESDRSVKSLTDKTGVLPRSILDTFDRIKRELDPEAEEDLVREFRSSKARTIVALRFILILVIVPLLTQQFSKNLLIGPVVDNFRDQQEERQIFLNPEMEAAALQRLERYEQHLKFEQLIGTTPSVTPAMIEEKVKQKAVEIQAEFYAESGDAVKNVFADILAALMFVLVLVSRRKEVEAIKSFMDQLVYGLSDSAKAFIIILLTDIFVGFHSPHGWEVLLEGLSKHFGLPADRNFIFLFIATFPVILDTIFKYWIFRYLNRVSPSAVATYKNMNE
jgi:hypothetical protein